MLLLVVAVAFVGVVSLAMRQSLPILLRCPIHEHASGSSGAGSAAEDRLPANRREKPKMLKGRYGPNRWSRLFRIWLGCDSTSSADDNGILLLLGNLQCNNEKLTPSRTL